MPWNLLGLDPETASEREVKRAYARRLRVTRPDKDPAGFQELREAYETALLELQFRSISADADSEQLPERGGEERAAKRVAGAHSSRHRESGPAGTAVSGRPERPEEFAASLVRLQSALRSGEAILEATRDFEQVLYSHPELVEDWGAEIAALVEAGVAAEGFELTVDALLFELEHESSTAMMAVIRHAEGTAGKEVIGSLASLLLEHKARISNPSGGKALARLASAAAVWKPELCEGLADAAYELLPTVWRDHLMGLIESDLSLGQFVRELPEQWRPFWVRRLRDPEGGWDWTSAESRAALESLRREQPSDWAGLKLIASFLPEGLGRELLSPRPPREESNLRPVSFPPPLPPPVRPGQIAGASSKERSKGPLLVVGCLVALVVIQGAVALLRGSGSVGAPPRTQPSRADPAYPPSPDPASFGRDWEDPTRPGQRPSRRDQMWRGSPPGPSHPGGRSIPSGPRPYVPGNPSIPSGPRSPGFP